jgi:hypothetical protein
VSSCLWSISESRRIYWFPSGLHCAYIASAIKFAFSTISSPLSNVNVYSCVSRMGLALASPTGLLSLFLFREVTRPFTRVLPHGTEISALRWLSPISGITSRSLWQSQGHSHHHRSHSQGSSLCQKSCSIALGPRWWVIVSLNSLCISWWIEQWISLFVRCRRVDLQRVCPFDLRILVV